VPPGRSAQRTRNRERNAINNNNRSTTKLAATAPATVNRTIRRPNAELRTREHLTTAEVERLIEAAKGNRQGNRDALMVLLAFRHGLRAAEVCDLRWEQIDFKAATIHIRRVKNGTPATHPLTGRELRALRQHQRDYARGSAFVFVSERGAPLSAPGFSRMIERAGRTAKLQVKVHAHMLRHACGFALANAGHDTRSLQAYLGHRNIQNTTRYAALVPDRFAKFWRD
jgi:type 1 fimbriae regulatory protein FimB/type 1 fimbriae regulatory protein FimE